MKRFFFFCVIFIALSVPASAMEFSFFGIQKKHFENRKPIPVILGAVSAYFVHEGGHMLAAELCGYKSRWDGIGTPVVWTYNENNYDYGKEQMINRAGFLADLFVGGILTAIPETRHSDFTVGFNALSMVHDAAYSITGGIGSSGSREYSDVLQLERGREESMVYAFVHGYFLKINLDEY